MTFDSYQSPVPDLPIDSIKPEFIAALASHNTILLSAPPGAGKSTQLPLWLLQQQQDRAASLDGTIIMLQPRRLAAKSVAMRLARQLGESVGETVGYRIRNESKVGKNTRLQVVTEGILARMLQHDPELEGVAMVIFDEFHERNLHADLAFALSRDSQQALRDDLIMLIMSATLDVEDLQRALPDAITLSSPGRSYPVDIDYQPLKPGFDFRQHALAVAKNALLTETGSILVFLPGAGDIRFLQAHLEEFISSQKLDAIDVLPLYSDLSMQAQQQAIKTPGEGLRKIVLATNIAETSITIDGISLVIDSGLANMASFNQDTLSNELRRQPVAKSSAIQRSGRAGRTGPGKAIRLYGNEEFARRPEQSPPDILQLDLLPATMEVATWGAHEFKQLPFLDCPDEVTESRNWHTLEQLDIVNEKRQLTPHGKAVSAFAAHPRFAHMLLRAKYIEDHEGVDHLTDLACLVAALLEERDLLPYNREFYDSDLALRVHHLVARQYSDNKPNQAIKQRILAQAKQLARKLSFDSLMLADDKLPFDYLGVLIALAYPERIAGRRPQGQGYLCANGKGARLHPQDKFVGEAFLAIANLHGTAQEVRLSAAISKQQIETYFAEHIITKVKLQFDEQRQKISAERQVCIEQLVLAREDAPDLISADTLVEMWCEHIEKKGLAILQFSDSANELLARSRWLASRTLTLDSLELPDWSEEALITSLADWLGPYLHDVRNVKALKALNITDILWNSLSYQQQTVLQEWAPQYYSSATGNRRRLHYTIDQPPKVSLPMQEVYGLTESPTVANGQVAVTLELLSPAGRPIQVTQDLAGFWQGSYREVQKEMKGRYPKHFWPDDPQNAQATNKTKKRMQNER
ncbi:ATP-dependent helicase HrpB [Thalassotalea mangrovi]|uniref:ATP-dependent helicase HrpB n=1 Tax=Thalassotalea mangrovi TaxID=2572245 RepID=A0A4U1B4P0_9GAMM|nr:ATP-dependent helicase HrpB [Thalassotalea mangrovi]TKB45350.1 ATP-dependent helicase HrpB [Thalassotalea mangrovi]